MHLNNNQLLISPGYMLQWIIWFQNFSNYGITRRYASYRKVHPHLHLIPSSLAHSCSSPATTAWLTSASAHAVGFVLTFTSAMTPSYMTQHSVVLRYCNRLPSVMKLNVTQSILNEICICMSFYCETRKFLEQFMFAVLNVYCLKTTIVT